MVSNILNPFGQGSLGQSVRESAQGKMGRKSSVIRCNTRLDKVFFKGHLNRFKLHHLAFGPGPDYPGLVFAGKYPHGFGKEGNRCTCEGGVFHGVAWLCGPVAWQ
jgi:hypothetical protein